MACPEDQEYNACASFCTVATCEQVIQKRSGTSENNNPYKPFRMCIKGCYGGCFCKNGLVRSNDGTCVKPETC